MNKSDFKKVQSTINLKRNHEKGSISAVVWGNIFAVHIVKRGSVSRTEKKSLRINEERTKHRTKAGGGNLHSSETLEKPFNLPVSQRTVK